MKRILPKISKRKILTFSVFFVIAAFFWVINALRNDYLTSVNYSIEYKGVPESYTSNDNLPKELKVTVKSTGFNILWLQNQDKTVVIDFQKNAVYDKKDKSKLILYTSKLRNKLVHDTFKIKILNIDPKYIILNTQKVVGKKVPVVPRVKIFCKTLFMQAGDIEINPDSITIFTVKDIAAGITEIETEEKIYKDLDRTVEDSIQLKKIKDVNFSTHQINITVPIEKYTESIIKIKIEIVNCPTAYKIITFPGDVSVKYKVVLSRFDKISHSDFKAVIDYNDIYNNSSSKLKVKLIEFPKFITDININPEFVEFLTEKIE
jgi:hypothetical protein